MSRVFTVQRGATRVVFGAGSSGHVDREIDALGLTRVLVVSTRGRQEDAARIASQLGSRAVGVLAEAREHVPLETATAGRTEAARTNADAVLAIGGGSAIGLAKAIALDGRARVVAIPTTYAGSEMTAIYGITEGEQKRTGRDERVRAALVLYDPRLTDGLPREIATASLWNALAHAVEALWIKDTDGATRLVAEEAIRLLASGMTKRGEDAMEGAYLAGVALDVAGAGLHHKICHVLGGMFRLPHAATHAVMLPHVARAMRDPDAMARIARALGTIDAIRGLGVLAKRSGAPRSLAALGMPKDGIARAAAGLPPEALAILTHAYDPPAPTPSPAIRGPETLRTQPGFRATHESEALEGALPRTQNTPRRAPYGLYPELLSGTPFTVRNADNARTWMYRIRASFSHEAYVPLPAARFGAPFEDASPNRVRFQPLPLPEAPEEVDFLDGLVTLGGSGAPGESPGYAVHLYAANADMAGRCFSDCDGDLLIVPEKGTLECQTELGWLRVSPGSVLLVPRGLKFAIGIPDQAARGWVLETWGTSLRLPERGLIGSNGLADARHFLAPVAAYEDRAHPGYELVTKLCGGLHVARQDHTPFDVVAWHGNHVPCTYDLSLFNAMGTVTWDHPDPSILTVLTAPLDDRGRAVADFVIFPGRWDVAEHSFRPPFMHRNAATEINGVIRTPAPESGYVEGCTFVTPLLTAHGVATKTYDAVMARTDAEADAPRRMPDASLWMMFESALPFRRTAWARETPLVDASFAALSEGMRVRFDPSKR